MDEKKMVSLTIELTPEQQSWLAALARQQGLEPAELARRLVVEHLTEPASEPECDRKPLVPPGMDPNHFYFTATPEEWEAAMDELAEMNRGLPVLPDEAFDRENLYDERF